jgi:hypothetical protein
MKKRISLMLITVAILSMSGCEKGYFGAVGVLLSPARDVTGIWSGTLTCSWNNANNTNMTTTPMILNLVMDGNTVTGTMTAWGATGTITDGTINGVKIEFETFLGSNPAAAACIHVYGTFTSTNMKGMKGSSPPPYLTCYSTLNDGTGSKGIEWSLQKQ